MSRITAIVAATVLALGAGAAALAQTPAPATTQAPAATQQQARTHRSHVEGRIAFLKAELKLTDQQNAAFNRVADAMRANDRETAAAREEMKRARDVHNAANARPSAIERMESRQKSMAAASARNARALDAWKPLYTQLLAEQKQLADELLSRGGRGHGHRHGHRFG